MKSGQNAPGFRAAVSLEQAVFSVSQVRKLQLHSNTGDGTLPQAIPGGTRPKAGGVHDKLLKSSLHPFLLHKVSFTVMEITCNRQGV